MRWNNQVHKLLDNELQRLKEDISSKKKEKNKRRANGGKYTIW